MPSLATRGSIVVSWQYRENNATDTLRLLKHVHRETERRSRVHRKPQQGPVTHICRCIRRCQFLPHVAFADLFLAARATRFSFLC
ncbi:hypothetical protein HBI56_036270 [Parastagonospora nodorum]|nr:hypothetical protein HBH75_057300 [Parastagonospora nodorum]KAH4971200.1 hypothetical protein HBI78_029720 [Parastagonospora nodorum]KAH5108839.1 hypothetical protein HBH72_038230 [Parastagonospora nodorum]KAH5195682.1 hypothetical protein HBH76_046680 [Parastagonospora nodorum]KAH5220427.1 hypothetical protein HBH77_037590 [Parastagonospora nodorum]